MDNKLNFEDFCNQVENRFKEAMGEGYEDLEIGIKKVLKNNDTEFTALSFHSPSVSVSPVAYLEKFYEDRYCARDLSFDDVLSEIVDFMKSQSKAFNQDADSIKSSILDYNVAKDKIVPRLVNLELNKALLADRPFTQYLDFAVTYHVLIDENDDGISSVPITNSLLAEYGVSLEEIHAQAVSNIEKMGASVESLGAVLSRMLGGDDYFLGMPGPQLYVVSNKNRVNGSASILIPSVLEQLSDKFGTDLIILPSSIHEVLVMSIDAQMNSEELNSMIMGVNSDVVDPKDVLSEHFYYYDKEKHELLLDTEVSLEEEKENEEAENEETEVESDQEQEQYSRRAFTHGR